MAEIELYSLDELKDETLGKIGTPERDAYELEVKEAIQSYQNQTVTENEN